MLRSVKAAMPPALVVCGVVPLSVPVPVNIAIAIGALGTLLLNASCARTVTAGLIAAPIAVSVGCCTNVSVATVPAVMANALLSTEMVPKDAVNFFGPVTLMLRSLKVALPPGLVVRGVVPFSGPVPAVSVIAIGPPDTLLPAPSGARTVTAGLRATPATVVVG